MLNQPTFADALRALVAKEVQEVLAPYRDALASLVEFAGGEPAGEVRMGVAPVAAPARRPRGRHPAALASPRALGDSVELVGQFSEGQKVQYRQGRGTFDAKVIGIDSKRGVLTLERESDQKKVVRPAAKVIAA